MATRGKRHFIQMFVYGDVFQRLQKVGGVLRVRQGAVNQLAMAIGAYSLWATVSGKAVEQEKALKMASDWLMENPQVFIKKGREGQGGKKKG